MLANGVAMVVALLRHWHEEGVNEVLKHNILHQAKAE